MIDLNGQRLPFYDVMGRAFQADCVAGIPGISINAGVSALVGASPAGLPVGLMLQARRGDDERLLSAAAAVEAVLPPPPSAEFAPACAGCTARLGWVKVAYPAQSLQAAGPSTASMAYAEDSYVLDFGGDCAVRRGSMAFPMLGPHVVPGARVDWSSRSGVWHLDAPAGCAPAPAPAEQLLKVTSQNDKLEL
jgi:hypothetical protein